MSQKQEMATILTLWKINNPTSEKNSYFIITILIEIIDNEMITIQERLINGQLVN